MSGAYEGDKTSLFTDMPSSNSASLEVLRNIPITREAASTLKPFSFKSLLRGLSKGSKEPSPILRNSSLNKVGFLAASRRSSRLTSLEIKVSPKVLRTNPTLSLSTSPHCLKAANLTLAGPLVSLGGLMTEVEMVGLWVSLGAGLVSIALALTGNCSDLMRRTRFTPTDSYLTLRSPSVRKPTELTKTEQLPSQPCFIPGV